MDWGKVDAALAGALSDAEADAGRLLPVFVHLDAASADRSLLASLRLDPPGEESVCTATLSAADVERLTDQPWVKRLGLSGPLQLSSGD